MTLNNAPDCYQCIHRPPRLEFIIKGLPSCKKINPIDQDVFFAGKPYKELIKVVNKS